MQVHNNEITISRNESFSINKILQNRDGSPYIISSKLDNPYFLITVSNSRYSQTNRYVYNKWLKLDKLPRFLNTRPIHLKELGYQSFDGLSGTNIFTDESDYAVVTDGKSYKYWSEADFDWKDYSCVISTQIPSSVTASWSEQNYLYNILLVTGEDMESHIRNLAIGCNVPSDGDYLEVYERIKLKDPDLVAHIKNINRPIVSFSTVVDILPPTKLTVRSNMKGAMI